MNPPVYLSSSEVMMLTGMSHRQLDYACHEYIQIKDGGSGSGIPRRFVPEEVASLCAYAALQASGIPNNRMKDAVELLLSGEWSEVLIVYPQGAIMTHWKFLEERTRDHAWSTVIPLHRAAWRKAAGNV